MFFQWRFYYFQSLIFLNLNFNARGILKKGSGTLSLNLISLLNPEERGNYAEGDIMVPDGLGRGGFKNESISRWPNATVPYVIEGNYSAEQRYLIIQAINEIDYYSCIKFVKHSDQADYIAIVNVKDAGCSSYVGRIGGRQVVNLEAPLCLYVIGTPLHELFHAIGLLHEHNRSDRNQHITINMCNVQNAKTKFFTRYSEFNTDKRIKYNYNSIMHFSKFAASKNSRDTINPQISNMQIGQRFGISLGDANTVNHMYKCAVTEIYMYGRVRNITS